MLKFPVLKKKCWLSFRQVKGYFFDLKGRHYDPYSQKFLSEDPIMQLSGDLNLYRYVINMPLSFNDPSGLLMWPADVAKEAVQTTAKWFPDQARHNNAADAFRHCFASCRMTKENSFAIAVLTGGAQEMKNRNSPGYKKCEEDMDLRNNAIGRLYGLSEGDCREQCFEAAVTGVLTKLK